MYKNLSTALLLLLGLLPACKSDETSKRSSPQPAPLSVKRGLLIASGLGAIDGLEHTNSLEAFRCNYKRGFRWFEVDLTATAEEELVCFHKGDEKIAGLADRIWNLPISQVEGVKYHDRFPIVRFSNLISETDKLGDVVLVLDTEGWSKRMEESVSRTLGYGPHHSTRIVFQVYSEKDLESIVPLSKELGAGLLLNANHTEIDDSKVEELVKKHPFLGVVAHTNRFTPWLADRLHTAHVPLLVHTVNEHRDIVNLSRAGADGFYTDRYAPFESIAADPNVLMNCGETKPSRGHLRSWTERDSRRQWDYRLPGCGRRKSGYIELSECDDRALVRSRSLAVPAMETLHIRLAAEASDAPATFWVEVTQKKEPKLLMARELISLNAKQRNDWKFDVPIPQGSQGVEARLGLKSKADHLVVHRFRMFHGEDVAAASLDSAADGDAGE